jgi:phosphatidylglycerol---prolipoprotein diacylglyceryl transferase
VRWYGLAYLAGFLAAWWVLRVLDDRWGLGLGPDGRTTTVLAAVIGVVVGGRLGYVVFYNLGAYLQQPLKILAIWDGGMSFHGGLIGILLAGWWVSRHYHVPFLRLCDVGAVGAPVGIFFGRIANFINGELWGRVTTVPWGMVFPSGGPLPRHPSQLYEAGLEGLVIFVAMLLLARRRRADGFLVGWMMLLYGVFRIFVEFFREPDAQIGFLVQFFGNLGVHLGFLPGWLTMGQLLSIPLVPIGAWLVWRAVRTSREAAHGSVGPDDPEKV